MAAIQLNNIQYRGDNPEVAGMYENRAYKTDADLENANHRKNAAQYASKYKVSYRMIQLKHHIKITL